MRKICTLWMVPLLICSLLVTGCSPKWKKQQNEPKYTQTVTAKPGEEEMETGMSEEDAQAAALEYLGTMTLQQKIGQLFMVNLELLDSTQGDYYEHQKVTREMKRTLQQYPVGGVILFSRNIGTRKQTHHLIKRLQANSRIPLYVAVDEEGGDVSRIASNDKMKTTKFPSAQEIGQTQTENDVYNMGITIAREIHKLGFNLDLAPVADVKTSDMNQEIGTRSFGDDPDKVADMVSAFVTGMQEQNISSTLKHFPGQGSSQGDTHEGSVNIDSSINQMRKVDFVPFKAGIEAGADFVMVSHISVSKVTETSEPASMSELIMRTILRDELGFEGLVITDAFDMASITEDYSAGEAALKSLEAGADIVMMPQDLPEAFEAVENAVSSGEYDENLINDSVRRILAKKFQRGIMTLDDLTVAKQLVIETPTPEPQATASPATGNDSKDDGNASGEESDGKDTGSSPDAQ